MFLCSHDPFFHISYCSEVIGISLLYTKNSTRNCEILFQQEIAKFCFSKCIQKRLFNYLTTIILINTYHRSPLIRWTKHISFGMSVILFAWSAAKFPSSNVPERIIQDNIYITLELIRHDDVCNKFPKNQLLNKWASAASCKAPIAAACQLWIFISSNFGTFCHCSSGKMEFSRFILSHSSTTILTSMHLTSLNKMK